MIMRSYMIFMSLPKLDRQLFTLASCHLRAKSPVLLGAPLDQLDRNPFAEMQHPMLDYLIPKSLLGENGEKANTKLDKARNCGGTCRVKVSAKRLMTSKWYHRTEWKTSLE